jgi:hypothetical protein
MKDEKTPAAPQPTKAVERPAKPVLRTPAEWAKELGHIKPRRLEITLNGVAPSPRISSEHRRAATQHGWDAGDRRGDRPVSLTRKDYEAAIAAASRGESHEPALAPCRRK